MSLPDIDKVREYEPRGGLWRYKATDNPRAFVILVALHKQITRARDAVLDDALANLTARLSQD